MTAPLFGTDLFGEAIKPAVGALSKRFLSPPFSILDARSGEWQARKEAWLSIGIRSEVGRAGNLLNFSETVVEMGGNGTSIFDPVLCELAYSWWCPTMGQVLDPFAGGSVRGIVAALLGLRYWGCDLRAEQIAENEKQAAELLPEGGRVPQWTCGDSLERLEDAPTADFLFSCPPYGDLERYSDDPRDLSTMEWPRFMENYAQIVRAAAGKLRSNRFACFVVGEFRGPDGCYRNFVGETVEAFASAGLKFYNEAILVTSVGSAAMRALRIFGGGRKLCKSHQNVLVFVKGDWKAAAAMCRAEDYREAAEAE